MFRLFAVLCSALLLTNCINLKSKYVSPQYYTLLQLPISSKLTAIAPKNASLFIKEFNISSDLETSKIAILENGINIKYYNYHQWTSTLNEVLTEYTIARISRHEFFSKGVVQSAYSSTPDFMLDCKVLKCAINHYEDTETIDNVELSVNVTLFAADKANWTYNPVFVKTYSQTQACANNSLQSSVEALSSALSNMIDLWLTDMLQDYKL